MSEHEILAIDTSARGRAVVVVADHRGALLGGGTHGSGAHVGGQAGTLLGAALPTLLAAHRPAAVVVVTGPGSFTGLRAGMAAALGVAQAGGLPLYGVATLEVVALSTPLRALGEVVAVSAAGRGSVYAARYLLSAEGAPRLLEAPRRVPADWAPAGDVRAISSDRVAGTEHGDPALGLARAAALALGGVPLPPAGLAPVYLDGIPPI